MPKPRFNGLPPGTIIRTLREERGWTQAELAERVENIDAAGVSKVETGVTKLGAKRSRRFASALGVEPSLLLPRPEAQRTIQDVLDHLESVAVAQDESRAALAAILAGIQVQLDGIQASLQQLAAQARAR